MPPTVSWPTRTPSKVTTNGSSDPARAWLRRLRTMAAKLIGGPASTGGVASQGASQSRFTARTLVQASRSPRAIGRSATRASRSVAGQPRVIGAHPAPRPGPREARGRAGCSVVAPVDLLDGVAEQWAEHLQAVADPARRPGEVHDQRRPGQPGQPAREGCGRDALGRPVRSQRLGDARDRPVQHPRGHLGRPVRGGDAGAARGEHDVVRRGDRLAQDLLHGIPVGHHLGPVDLEPQAAQALDEDRAGAVLVDPGRGPVGDADDQRPHGPAGGSSGGAPRRHSPDRPPLLCSTRTSLIVAARSTALTMSTSARPATATQVSASISTPVRSAVRTVAETWTASSATARSTSTPWIATGWQSGTRSGVRLAAWMPAIRATASASPFGTPEPRSSATTSGDTRTRPVAVAVRAVTSLPETSTIRAAPDASTWVSRGSVIAA